MFFSFFSAFSNIHMRYLVIRKNVINKGIMNNKKVMNNVITYKLSA